MNINDFFNFSVDTEHNTKYETVVKALGYDNIRSIIPYSDEELASAYERDPYFNSISLKKWDVLTGDVSVVKNSRMEIHRYPSVLKDLLYKLGINSFSQSELVCILKCCARLCVLKNA